jgi:hypothetical protein
MKPEPALRISDKTRTATKADGTRIEVVDAKAKFIVRVLQEHIDAAVPNDPCRCMYCLACMDQHGSELVWVTRTRAYVELSNEAGISQLVRCVLPPGVIKYMRDHDMNLKHLIKPHTVTFDPPAPYQTLDRTFFRNRNSNQKLAEKRKAASLERKAAEMRRKAVELKSAALKAKVTESRLERGLPPFPDYEPIQSPQQICASLDPIPIPASLRPKLPKPETKKQDPTANFDLRPGGRGDYCFYGNRK